jgi:hypothetical protein
MELDQEIAEKALFIVQNTGETIGIYSQFTSGKLHISYTDYYGMLSVFYDLRSVLQSLDGRILNFTDGDWIHEINDEYRGAVKNAEKNKKAHHS